MAFQQLLEEAGCRVESSNIVFAVEPVLFRRTLGNKLRSQSNGFQEFSQDMQIFTEDPAIFKKFLLPSTLADNVPKTSRTSSSESLFKTLLAIDSIQPDLITYLLERLPEFYDELENDNSSSCTARLILHQLRWLDYIAQPEVLTSKLIEIIQITPPVIQHEIITSLPDMVNDSEHKTQPIVVYLKELMNENPELIVPILDALSNLTLHSESLEDVRETVLERLESAELDDLAVIVKFLLQTVTSSTIDSVVNGIREKLDFRALGKVQQQANSSQRRNAKDAPEALILESIKLGLQFHKFVCDSWLKSIVALESQRAHKLIDMLVLIILYSMTSMKKKVESIVRKKIVNGNITAALIQETIMCHADGLVGYWNPLLSLSESLLRSCQQNSAISPCASTLYTSSFRSSDAYYRQEIIGALVTHIGSGVEAEMNVALNVLLQLVKTNVSSVAVYSVFVKGILDYLDNLNVYQIRTLFDIFSLLALTTGNTADGSANLWSEIQIVIRKQLSNPREKYKNIGIIASLSSVKVLGSRKLCNDDQNGAGSSSLQVRSSTANNTQRHPLLRQATNLLESALHFTRDYPNCVALVYDELAHMIAEEDLDERLQIWIKENMASDFTEFYVAAVDDADEFIRNAQNNQYSKLEPEKKMNLDGDDCQIAVKMYQLIYMPDTKTKKLALVPLCSVFNLIQSCEKKLNNGSLQDVDALFGCSIVLFKTEDLEDISLEETAYACDMLFYTINWFKEILNSFIFTTEDNFRIRLVTRIRNILQMEEVLSRLMGQVPKYTPLEFHTILPTASASENCNRNTSQIISSPSYVESQGTTAGEQVLSHKAAKKDHKSSSITFNSISGLRPYMRSFYVHILEILKYNEEIEEESEKMKHEEINYILEDLNQKLDIKIVPPSPVFFGKKKAIVEEKYPSCNSTLLARMDAQNLMKKVILYLPHLLQTLESTYIELQYKNIIPGHIEEESGEIVQTVFHLFNVLFKLLSWPDIQNSDNSDILQDVIYAIASRITGDIKQKNKNSHETELGQAFGYLSHYGDNIPEAKTAVLLFKILQRLIVISENPSSLRKTALKVVNQIITTDWFDWRDIKKEIPYLFEEWIALNDDPLAILHDFINRLLPQYEQQGALEEYPLLKDDTIVQHYQAIIYQTVKAFDLLKNIDQDADIVLVENARIVKIFERITNYIKMKDQRVLLGVLLKTGRLFIEQFTKHSIPYFTEVFKSHSSSVIGIFKDFQASTRMLQIMCSHVKVLKEVQLSVYVPPLKKALEIVIYQVKMLIAENRISANAFYMGALKHRDIRGAEVSSQIPREEYDDNDHDDNNHGDNDQDEDEVASDNSGEEGEDKMSRSSVTVDENESANSRNKNKAAKRASAPSKQPKKRTSAKVINATSRKQPCKNSSLSVSVSVEPRTSSMVPSSSEDEEEQQQEEEEDDDENEAVVICATKNKRKIEKIEEDEEEEEVIEMNMDSGGDDDEGEDGNNAANSNYMDDNDIDMPPIRSRARSPSSPPRQTQKTTKKRRLGLGRNKSSQSKKIFNLTGPSDSD